MASQNEQLEWSKSELKKENDSLKLLASDLEVTKEQLAKTENVLIEFYLKYQGKSTDPEPKLSSQKEYQWDTIQTEMNALIKKNSALQDKINSYELELSNLRDELNAFDKKQMNLQENNKTQDQLKKQLDEANANQKKLKVETTNKEAEIVKLKNEINQLKSKQTDLQFKSTESKFLVDSLHSEIQYLELKNKNLTFQIAEQDEKIEELGKNYREQKNNDLIALQKEITDLNIRHQSMENENQTLLDSLRAKDLALTLVKQSLEESRNLVIQQRLQLEEKSKKKVESDLKSQIEQLKSDLQLSEKTLSALNDAIDSKNQKIENLMQQLNANNNEITKLKAALSTAEESKNNTLNSELNAKAEDIGKLENQVQSLQSEKESLLMNMEQLKTVGEKLAIENRNLNDELSSKNNQIEMLSLKLSERPAQDPNVVKVKSLEDSISLLRVENTRMQHVNRSLESEIKRNQNNLSLSSTAIDSLNKELLVLKNKPKEQYTDTMEQHALRLELSNSRMENKVIKQKMDSLKVVTSRNQTVSKPSLPEALVKKIKSFTTEYSQTGIVQFEEDNELNIILPQSYIFEGESFAMSQRGSDLIIKLCAILKSYPKQKLQLAGYGTYDATGFKSFENSFKRANTVYKLMSVSGINSNILKLESELNSSHINQKLPSSGVEITIHAE
jgi:chromosome segregation ATPase